MSAVPMATEPRFSIGLIDSIYGRRSVRSYEPDAIDDARVRALLDAAVHAPTAMHIEPWRFLVVQDRALLHRLSDRAKAAATEDAAHHGNLLKPPGAAGDGIASPIADPEFNIFYDAGTLVVVCARGDNDFAVADCWLAAENLMLAAYADGLGTCCIGFAIPVLNLPDVKSELGIPADMHAFAPIILGVPHGEVLQVPRKHPVVLGWIR
jgi:nitroreductase